MKPAYDQSERFQIAPGESFNHTFDDFQQGLRVDNFTNQWLFVGSLQRYIPPFTIAWQAYINPGTRIITIEPSAPPLGQTSLDTTNTGDVVNIEVTTYPIADSAGSQQSVSQSAISPRIFTYDAIHTTNAAANTTTQETVIAFVSTPATLRIKLNWVSMRLQNLSLTGTMIWLGLYMLNSPLRLVHLGVSYETPAQTVIFPTGGQLMPGPVNPGGVAIESRSNQANRSFELVIGYSLIRESE